MLVEFYTAKESTRKLTFSVILSRYKGQWVFVKHKARRTYEFPGGHIEYNETALEAAKRELVEETGALHFNIQSICDYSVTKEAFKDYGRLFLAEIETLGPLDTKSEIEKIKYFDTLPKNLTYPDIMPAIFNYVHHWYIDNKID